MYAWLDGVFFDDESFDQFNFIVFAQNSRLDHAMVLLDAKTVRRTAGEPVDNESPDQFDMIPSGEDSASPIRWYVRW